MAWARHRKATVSASLKSGDVPVDVEKLSVGVVSRHPLVPGAANPPSANDTMGNNIVAQPPEVEQGRPGLRASRFLRWPTSSFLPSGRRADGRSAIVGLGRALDLGPEIDVAPGRAWPWLVRPGVLEPAMVAGRHAVCRAGPPAPRQIAGGTPLNRIGDQLALRAPRIRERQLGAEAWRLARAGPKGAARHGFATADPHPLPQAGKEVDGDPGSCPRPSRRGLRTMPAG